MTREQVIDRYSFINIGLVPIVHMLYDYFEPQIKELEDKNQKLRDKNQKLRDKNQKLIYKLFSLFGNAKELLDG
jgi:hypothetical protein